jgi:DNA polymerase-3 subunit alpha
VDFCERRRGEVISYVTEKYGRENVAQIITFGTMKAKAAVRDVGRVMEMPIADVNRVANLIPNQLEMTLDLALQEAPALADLEKNDPARQGTDDRGQAARRDDATRVCPRRGRRHYATAR